MPHFGKVYLIGAGPGDPGLLTLRGRERLEQADVVVYDALAHPDLLRFAPRAEHIYVGKQRGQHSLPQDEINRILIEKARQYAHVARLKGGDPCVFGRGGEEALALAEAGIGFEIIPGVTAGVAAPAYAGIPVTHRGISSAVTFLTAHLEDDGTLPNPGALLQQGTLVLYMGVKSLPQMVDALLAHGRAASTPATIIEWGTYARQRCVAGTLGDIAARCVAENIESPALVVVGEVCALRDKLHWFESRPLHGLRVVVTHAEDRRGFLESRLRELGAEIFSLPMIRIAPAPQEEQPTDFSGYDWIVLTSVNAAKMLFGSLARQGKDARALAGVRLCAVGASARDAVEGQCLRVDAVPEGYGTESVLTALQAGGQLNGARVLIPRSDIARRALGDALRGAGAVVTETVAYTHQPPALSGGDVEALGAFNPSLLVFTNASAVEHFAQCAPPALLQTPVASIGPVTTKAAQLAGMRVAVEPARHTLADLLDAICAWQGK